MTAYERIGSWAMIATCAAVAGCHRVPDRAPPRVNTTVRLPAQTSQIDVPVSANLGDLSAALDKAVPRRLWTIDKPGQTCVASKRVKVLFAKIKTPTVTCRIVGEVTRGEITVAGQGQRLHIVMPIRAIVSARDIGGVVGQETATADARVNADVRLDIARDWTPTGTVDIHYDWTDSPHIDLLGQRIEFTSKADDKLKGVIAKLERTLPAELAKLHVRDKVQQAWGSAFTSLQVNKANPPAWIRITPRDLSYGGYQVNGRTLMLRLGMSAQTETFVGPRPADPTPTPLPPLRKETRPASRIVFALPVIASYDQLEPVLAKALAKRAQRPFDVPGIGQVTARFGKVTAYGTEGGKIAVGLAFSAAMPGSAPARGTVWLTARPVNAPNSRRIGFTDLSVSGVTDSTGTDLLIRLANAPGLSATIADVLTQNFSDDYQKLLGKIGRAIAEKRTGDLVIRATIADVRTGRLQALGQGVYLPVEGRGTAAVALDAQ